MHELQEKSQNVFKLTSNGIAIPSCTCCCQCSPIMREADTEAAHVSTSQGKQVLVGYAASLAFREQVAGVLTIQCIKYTLTPGMQKL